MKKTKVAVLAGGPDAEHGVSLMSGRAVAAGLMVLSDEFDVSYHVVNKLTSVDIAAINADVIFPALHGCWGEGGPLQELLEIDGRPFVGADAQAAYLAMDKMRTKKLAAELGIPTPPACELNSLNDKCPLDLPLVIKPVNDGSSVDIKICKDAKTLDDARNLLHPRRTRLMAEQYIPGRELTVGLIGSEVSSLIEIVPATEFYDYAAKYDSQETKYIVNPPDLSHAVADKFKQYALDIYRAVNARDIARVDFIYNDSSKGVSPVIHDIARGDYIYNDDDSDSEENNAGIWFLEINTMPGFTAHSLVPMGAYEVQGWDMPELCKKLVEMALSRNSDSVF